MIPAVLLPRWRPRDSYRLVESDRLEVTLYVPRGDLLHARFGGGWHWKLGVQVSRSKRSMIVNLIWAYVRIERPRARVRW